VSGDEYWGELWHGTRPLGAAFFLTRRFLLTAEHCVHGLPEDDAKLTVVRSDGSTLDALVYESVPEADLAVLLLAQQASGVRPLSADECAPRDRWRVPSRPSPADPRLYGSVAEPDVPYRCVRGGTVQALELRTEVELGDYSGYSGGPVEKITDTGSTLAGVLIEQYPDRQDPDRASNVLFAATIQEVLRRFECFDPPKVLERRAREPADDQMSQVDATRLRGVLDGYTEILRQARSWEQDELIQPAQLAELRLRVARSVVDQAMMWSRGD
jgi:hypothetical protein